MRAYKANMIPGGVTPTINVSQYDNDYAVTVTLIEGAEIYTPPVGATIRVEGTKPDGHGFEYPCTYQGNVVTMPIYTQMTVVAGRFPIELVVYQSGLRVGSCNIIFAVERAPLGEGTDISETVIPDIIAGAQAQADAAAASATTASSAATNAVSARDAAIEAAQAAAQSAASLTVDTELSSTSTNPVQNKVIDATVTELKNDLDENVSELTLVNEIIYDETNIPVYQTSTGWRLNASNGLCSSNSSYQLVKYAVTAGDIVKVVSDDLFQFQSEASVPSTGTSNRVGDTYGTGTFYLSVPNSATYIVFSTPISNSNAVAYLVSSAVDEIKSDLSNLEDVAIKHPITEYLKADVRSGSLQSNGTYSTDTTGFGVGYKIPLAPNGKIKITPYGPEGFKYIIRFAAFAEGESSGTLTQTTVINDENYTFTQPDAKSYLMFCLYYKHSDGTDYNDILDEFSATDVLVKTEILTEILPLAHEKEIEAVQGQITEQAETLAYDDTYLNIIAGASTFQDNKFVNDAGIVVSNSNFCLIDGYFPVKPNTSYKLYREEPSLYSDSGHNWTWWDKNKSFISYVLSGSTVKSPANAAFLRFAVYISSTGLATHQDFDPTKVVITEDAKPFFDDVFIKTASRPTFNGLKWIGIGDSITEANFRATYHYWDYIVAETGLNFVNMGVSGTGYKAEGSGDKAFYKRVPSMAIDADVITIFGGVNDVVLSNATIGTETDTGTDTICGCVNTTLDRIEALYPAHMPIGIISPLPCACVDTSVNLHPVQNPADDSCRMAQFVEQLSLICKHRGIPFLDLFHQSNLRPWHQECNAKYFSCDSARTGDGLHLNGYGHRLIYRQILDFVQKIVMK